MTQSVTTQGQAMMEGTALDRGPVTPGKDKMECVTWSATAYSMTMMMEIAVTQNSLMSSRPALIQSLLTGALSR